MFESVRISFSYGSRKILEGIDLALAPGETVALTGDNGAGKTTLLSILCGRLKPSSGSVRWNGQDITSLPLHERARLGVGFLPQNSSVLGQVTVGDNLRIVRELLPAKPAAPEIDDLLASFGLTELKTQKAVNLSGGERRRLELARAFLTRPRVLILDEPFTGLDSPSIESLSHRLLELRGNLTILLSDHHARLVARLATRCFRLVSGQLQEEQLGLPDSFGQQ